MAGIHILYVNTVYLIFSYSLLLGETGSVMNQSDVKLVNATFLTVAS
jgi:hypothetical protein